MLKKSNETNPTMILTLNNYETGGLDCHYNRV